MHVLRRDSLLIPGSHHNDCIYRVRLIYVDLPSSFVLKVVVKMSDPLQLL